jgi:hypothetical protein
MNRGEVYIAEIVGTDRVKIGFTSKTSSERLASLDTTSMPGEIRLVHSIHGDERLERWIHDRFRAERVRSNREWFYRRGALGDLVTALVCLRDGPFIGLDAGYGWSLNHHTRGARLPMEVRDCFPRPYDAATGHLEIVQRGRRLHALCGTVTRVLPPEPRFPSICADARHGAAHAVKGAAFADGRSKQLVTSALLRGKAAA